MKDNILLVTLILSFCVNVQAQVSKKVETMSTITCECLENKSEEELDNDFQSILNDCNRAATLGALLSMLPTDQDSTITLNTDGSSSEISEEDKIASQLWLEENCETYNIYTVSSSEMDAIFRPILENSCTCIEQISTALPIEEKNNLIKECIEKSIDSSKISELINIEAEDVYAGFYEDVSKNLFELCPAVELVVLSDSQDKLNAYSSSEKAMSYYDKGLEALKKEEYKAAAKQFKKAVQEDDQFVYAWDNLGISYRYLEKYDDAITSYKKSIAVDSLNRTSLMNIAVAYNYKSDFKNSEIWYSKFKSLYPSDPEGHYGLSLSLMNQNKLERALYSIIEAYDLYKEQGSPYIADAEKVMSYLYSLFENENKIDKFKEICEEKNIKIGE